jgi:uncharacterized membrane protein YvbJ
MSSQPLTCPQCNFNNREGSRFCGQCGSSLVKYCPQCGHQMPVSASVCESCGVDSGRILASGERCQRCGLQNDEDAELCARCGARLLTKCPQCGQMTRARLSFCAHCGFDYSRFVAQKVIDELKGNKAEETGAARALGPSSGVMITLIIFSLILIIYILRQL